MTPYSEVLFTLASVVSLVLFVYVYDTLTSKPPDLTLLHYTLVHNVKMIDDSPTSKRETTLALDISDSGSGTKTPQSTLIHGNPDKDILSNPTKTRSHAHGFPSATTPSPGSKTTQMTMATSVEPTATSAQETISAPKTSDDDTPVASQVTSAESMLQRGIRDMMAKNRSKATRPTLYGRTTKKSEESTFQQELRQRMRTTGSRKQWCSAGDIGEMVDRRATEAGQSPLAVAKLAIQFQPCHRVDQQKLSMMAFLFQALPYRTARKTDGSSTLSLTQKDVPAITQLRASERSVRKRKQPARADPKFDIAAAKRRNREKCLQTLSEWQKRRPDGFAGDTVPRRTIQREHEGVKTAKRVETKRARKSSSGDVPDPQTGSVSVDEEDVWERVMTVKHEWADSSNFQWDA
ncbi:uncharacterized protein KY384_002444 [Bacidia gigantensis]|uniref:uncharacterized protein n=1 Tax=Bacidia gigantensis TaxID=2732470 RepID=UPI001D05B349|nr:uncharacterized protein KY384_002444 [Bacidia gigantensis]KAG8532567.1 hypothetical protein KY384_002444 [Bacidia gigantensis]